MQQGRGRLGPIERYDGEGFHLTGDPRPGGSSGSMGVFTRGGKRYIGKADLAENFEATYKAALQEICANDIYAFYGCHAQKLILSKRAWVREAGSIDFVEYCGFPEPMHLMTEWIEHFSPFQAHLIEGLRHHPELPVFLYHTPDGVLEVRGLGQILAVALWLNDIDCLGNAGANVGFTVMHNEDNVPIALQSIKIDPQYSFSPIGEAVVRALRNGEIFVGTTTRIHFADLPEATKAEFLEATRMILDTPEEQICSFFTREGLAPLFPNEAALHARVSFLRERQAMLRETYGPLLGNDHRLTTPEACRMAIQTRYAREASLRDPITGMRHPIEERFVHLSLLAKNDEEVERDTTFVEPVSREGLISSFEAIRLAKKDLPIDGLLANDSPRNWINIMGGAGIGKSTLCQFLVSQWAKGMFFREYTLMILIPLRHLTSQRYPSGDAYTLTDILIQEVWGGNATPQLRHIFSELYNPHTSVLILDGYDEIIGRVPEHLMAAFDQMMNVPHRILTGRPHAMLGLPNDKEVEVSGFKDNNILECIKRIAEEREATELHQYIQSNSLLLDLAHIPINLSLLCHVLKERGRDLTADMTLTQLYTQMEALMWRRYCQRQGENMATLTPERIEALTTPLAQTLSRVALLAMKAGKILLSGAELLDFAVAFNVDEGLRGRHQEMQIWRKLMDAGFIVQAQATGREGDFRHAQFSFLHLTLQEYFAAKELHKAVVYHEMSEMRWMHQNRYTQRLEVMWWFTSGLISLTPSPILERFAALWLEAPRDFGRQWEVRIVIRMAEEGRWYIPERSAYPAIGALMKEAGTTVLAKMHQYLNEKDPFEYHISWWNSLLKDSPNMVRHILFDNERFSADLRASLLLPDLTSWHSGPLKRKRAVEILEILRIRILDSAFMIETLSLGCNSPAESVRSSLINRVLPTLKERIFNYPPLIEAVCALLFDEDISVPYFVCQAVLGPLGTQIVKSERLMESIRLALQTVEEKRHKPLSGIEGVLRFFGPALLDDAKMVESLATLLRRCTTPGSFLRDSALSILKNIGPRLLSCEPLMEALRSPAIYPHAQLMLSELELKAEGVVPCLIAGLKNPDSTIRSLTLAELVTLKPRIMDWAPLTEALQSALLAKRSAWNYNTNIQRLLQSFGVQLLEYPWMINELRSQIQVMRGDYDEVEFANDMIRNLGPRISECPALVEDYQALLQRNAALKARAESAHIAREAYRRSEAGIREAAQWDARDKAYEASKSKDKPEVILAVLLKEVTVTTALTWEQIEKVAKLGHLFFTSPLLLECVYSMIKGVSHWESKAKNAFSVVDSLIKEGHLKPPVLESFFNREYLLITSCYGAVTLEGNTFCFHGKSGEFRQELPIELVTKVAAIITELHGVLGYIPVKPGADSARFTGAFEGTAVGGAGGGGGAMPVQPPPAPAR